MRKIAETKTLIKIILSLNSETSQYKFITMIRIDIKVTFAVLFLSLENEENKSIIIKRGKIKPSLIANKFRGTETDSNLINEYRIELIDSLNEIY